MRSFFLASICVIATLYSCQTEKAGQVSNIPAHVLVFNELKESGAIIGGKMINISAIPLETAKDCMIGNIEQLRISNNKLFIMDREMHSLLVFNQEGHFLFKISAQGRGPGEYEFLRDFYIDEALQEIVILGSPNKIIRYSMNGDFIAERSLSFNPLKVTPLPDGDFFFWNGVNSTDFAPLIRTDSNFNLVEGYFWDREEQLTTSNMITDNIGGIYLRPFFDNHENIVYQLTTSGVTAKFQMDFGSNNWPHSFEINNSSPLRDDGYVYGIRDFFEGNQWISFKFSSKRIIHHALYNVGTMESYWWPCYLAGTLPEAILSSIHLMEDDVFYSIVEPLYIKSYLADNMMNDMNHDYTQISDQLNELYCLFERTNELDNPIVVTFGLSPN